MTDNNENNNNNPYRMWAAIIIALILLFVGFYLYYYYPEIMPGMASIQPEEKEDVNEPIDTNGNQQNEEKQAGSKKDNQASNDLAKKDDSTDRDKGVSSDSSTNIKTPEQPQEKKLQKTELMDNKKEAKEDENDSTTVQNEEKLENSNTEIVQSKEQNDESKTVTNTEDKEVEQKDENKVNVEDNSKDKGLFQKIKEGIGNVTEKIKEGVENLFNPTLQDEVNVLVLGLDDMNSVNKGEIAADAALLININPKTDTMELTNIITNGYVLSNNEEIKEERILKYIGVVEDSIGIKADYYFSISYQGFVNLVNNLDGIQIERKEKLQIPDLDLDLKPGKNILNGKEALNYARWYDYRKDKRERIERQQQIIEAMYNKAFTNISILDVPQLFRTTVDTFKMVNTNMEYNMIKDIVAYFNKTSDLKIKYNIIEE